jgi:hypothetical protein
MPRRFAVCVMTGLVLVTDDFQCLDKVVDGRARHGRDTSSNVADFVHHDD